MYSSDYLCSTRDILNIEVFPLTARVIILQMSAPDTELAFSHPTEKIGVQFAYLAQQDENNIAGVYFQNA